jgi:hypothetical protein
VSRWRGNRNNKARENRIGHARFVASNVYQLSPSTSKDELRREGERAVRDHNQMLVDRIKGIPATPDDGSRPNGNGPGSTDAD